jgi:hypothetical protein
MGILNNNNFSRIENNKTKVYLVRILEDFINPYFYNENQYKVVFEYDKLFERHLFTITPKTEQDKKVNLYISLTRDYAVHFTLSFKEPESKNIANYRYMFLYSLDKAEDYKETIFNEYILHRMQETGRN